MLDSTQSSDGVITKPSSKSVPQTIDGLRRFGAGLFAAGALIFTALNFDLLRRNSERADKWQRNTHDLTKQGQVTDRYTKAIEQLGSDNLGVRVGGIYALERIARDSAIDHPTVMEMLTAFIRENSHEQRPQPDPGSKERFRRRDIQAAVSVVGRREVKHDIRSIHLARAPHGREPQGRGPCPREPHSRIPRPRAPPRREPYRREPYRRETHPRGPYRREPHKREPHPRGTHRRGPHRR